MRRTVGLLIITCGICVMDMLAAAEASNSKTITAPPENVEALKLRIDELRREMAPYLRSLPEKVDLRKRQDLCGDDWLSKYEMKKAPTLRSTRPGRGKFEHAPVERPANPGWEAPGLVVADWEKTTVPEWRYEEVGRFQPKSCILWYRKTFKAERPAAGRRVFLCFEGVDWEAEVWLNGKFLGGHAVRFEPFRFDVTDVLAEENTLAVRVIDGPLFGEDSCFTGLFMTPSADIKRYVRDRSRSLGGVQKYDTHNGSGYGIHREVYLEATAQSIVTQIRARGYPSRNEAIIQVETDLAADRAASLKVDLLPENFEGKSYTQTAPVDAATGKKWQKLSIPTPEARVWSPQSPHLYRCRVSLLDQAGKVMDVQDTLFGCRSMEMVSETKPREGLPPGMYMLNGQPLFIRGAGLQGENAYWYWHEDENLLDMLLMVKAAGHNAVRADQHVQFPEVRELLDRLGILSQQDLGSQWGKRGPQTRPGMIAGSAALARAVYNNPGVILVSLAQEAGCDEEFIRSVLREDPERLILPVTGTRHGGTFNEPISTRHAFAYIKDDAIWEHIQDCAHPYWGWYGPVAQPWYWCRVLAPNRMTMIGEYGAEGFDGYETMLNYPKHWGPTPPKDADTLWGEVQLNKKDDPRLIFGFRGRKPSNLGEYIEAGQNYQYDMLVENTKGFRLSARRISGYFQYHFIDVTPANWPKSVVSHDLRPKRAYFGMAQVNQPLAPLFRFGQTSRGDEMELWVANDLPQAFPGCKINWSVTGAGKTLAQGEQAVDVPASHAIKAGMAALKSLPPEIRVVDIGLQLMDAAGKPLSAYKQEFYIGAWRDPRVKVAEIPAEIVAARDREKQPLIVLPRLMPKNGQRTFIQLWLANSLPQDYPGSIIRWRALARRKADAKGGQMPALVELRKDSNGPIDIWASATYLAQTISLEKIPSDAEALIFEFEIENRGTSLSRFETELPLGKVQ